MNTEDIAVIIMLAVVVIAMGGVWVAGGMVGKRK